jgi:hypothetical protein
MEKKENKYESPLITTVEVKNEGVICDSCAPVNSVISGGLDTGGGSGCPDIGYGGPCSDSGR